MSSRAAARRILGDNPYTAMNWARETPLEKRVARSWTRADGSRRDARVSVATQRLVLMQIASYADAGATGYGARPSMALLIDQTALNERTIRMSIRVLQAQGKLRVLSYGTGRLASTYQLLLRPPLQAVDNPPGRGGTDTTEPVDNPPDSASPPGSVPPLGGHVCPPTIPLPLGTSLKGDTSRSAAGFQQEDEPLRGTENIAAGCAVSSPEGVADAGAALRAAARQRLAEKKRLRKAEKRRRGPLQGDVQRVLGGLQPPPDAL